LEKRKITESSEGNVKPMILQFMNLSSLDQVKQIVDDNDYIIVLNSGFDSVIRETITPSESNFPGMTVMFTNYALRFCAFTNVDVDYMLTKMIKEKQDI